MTQLGPYELNQIYTGDCRELSRLIPDESVDLEILDPPYGINYASSRTTQNNGQLRKTESSFGPDLLDTSFLVEAIRILKSTGALYLFTRWDVLEVWKSALKDLRLNVKQRIIWNKSHWKMGDLRFYGNQVEDILFCPKPLHTLRWQKRSGNLWSSSSSAYLPESQFDHPTQKPEAIISKMILNSSDAGDIVVDFHSGSGTTAACAVKLGRHFWCCDIRQKYVDMSYKRVELAQPPLFVVQPEQAVMDL